MYVQLAECVLHIVVAHSFLAVIIPVKYRKSSSLKMRVKIDF